MNILHRKREIIYAYAGSAYAGFCSAYVGSAYAGFCSAYAGSAYAGSAYAFSFHR